MRCDKCWSGNDDDNTGTNITWSEYEHKIWCYDCEIDTEGFEGIFGGPIPIRVTYMLGLNFNRINLETKEIELFNLDTGDYDSPEIVKNNIDSKEITKKLLKDKNPNDPYGIETQRIGSKNFKLVPVKKHS